MVYKAYESLDDCLHLGMRLKRRVRRASQCSSAGIDRHPNGGRTTAPAPAAKAGPKVAAARDARVPLRHKMGIFLDVANAALFLASDEAQFHHRRAASPVDGGALVHINESGEPILGSGSVILIPTKAALRSHNAKAAWSSNARRRSRTTLVKVFSGHIGYLWRGREIDDRLSATKRLTLTDRSSATPPPGRMPSSTAARVACRASSFRSLRSFTSTSVAPPTRITATPPASLASRSCNFSRS